MSVIGYICQCDCCNAKMLVTAEARDMKFCPECLNDFIMDAIDDAVDADLKSSGGDDLTSDDFIPPGQVSG